MSFQENKKTEKYKMLLQQQIRFHAFHPKAVNNWFACGRSSGSLPAEHLPIPKLPEQWYEVSTVMIQKWTRSLQLRG